MISIENELFELPKINFCIEFMNKTKTLRKSENLKLLLKTHFSEYKFEDTNIKNNTNINYLKFYEAMPSENEDEKAIQYHCKLFFFFEIGERPERREKIITNFQKYKESLINEKRITVEKLIIFSDREEVTPRNPTNFDTSIIKLNNEIEMDSEDFLQLLEKIIKSILKEYLLICKIESERLEKDEVNDKRTKNIYNLKKRSLVYLHLGEYKFAYSVAIALSEIAKQMNDNLSHIEYKSFSATSLFLDEYSRIHPSIKDLKFNTDIETLLEYTITSYKKIKNSELTLDSYLKLAFYYSFFPDKSRQLFELIKKMNEEIDSLSPRLKLSYLFRIKIFFKCIKMTRKSVFYSYMAISLCLENLDFIHLLPFIFKELNEKFTINDIYNEKIGTPDEFNELHKKILKSYWKKISFNSCPVFEEKNKMKESTKKRIDKESKLYVTFRLDDYKKYLLSSYWQPIQYNLFTNIFNYYNLNGTKIKLAYGISYLQTLAGFTSSSEQKKLVNGLLADSSLLQEKIYLNLIKLPILMKILPVTSEVKFDVVKSNKKKTMLEETENTESNVFLYNPWERDETINYYWTENSYQKIIIQFYNPLNVELKVNKIVLLCEGNKPFSFPTSTIINPNSIQLIICKLRLQDRGITHIVGLKYEIFNTVGIQFVDVNGNGLFFGYENFSKDPLSSFGGKKEKINLKNIKIYPPIPNLEIKILDSSSKIINGCLDLFNYQYYNFSFLLTNKSEHPIEEIYVNVYGYKKDDYKILINEIKIKKEGNLIEAGQDYIYNYEYLHRKCFKKIEFKIYYTASKYTNSEADVLLKPYLLYQKSLNTIKLLDMSNLKVIPMLSNNMIHTITLSDPKINKDYSKFFCSDKFYVSFIVSNLHDDNINFEIMSGENCIKQEICDTRHSKEISLVIDSEIKMCNFKMKWDFSRLKDVNGIIDFSQIFKEFSFQFQNPIKFEIFSSEKKTSQGIDYILVEYKIMNHLEKRFKNLKLHIYLYQVFDEENIIFNNQLSDDIYYEGSLFYNIKKLQSLQSVTFNLKLFPTKKEHISTTCLVVDQQNEVVYMSPISKSFYLK